MFWRLPAFDYAWQNIPDVSHNLSCVWKMLMKILVGIDSRTDTKHRAESEIHGVFPSIWLGENGFLPWRLTPAERRIADTRVRAIVYPHNCATVGYDTCSFWENMSCTWKLVQRMFSLLVVMPVTLRGLVPAVHRALLKVALGIRILFGNTVSYNGCVGLGIEPGSRCLKRTDVVVAHQLIVTGISMLEGCVPVSEV